MRVPIRATTALLLLCRVAGAGSVVRAYDGAHRELRGRELADCAQSECIQDDTRYPTMQDAANTLPVSGGYVSGVDACASMFYGNVGNNPDPFGGTDNTPATSCEDANKHTLNEQDCRDRADAEGLPFQQVLNTANFPSGCWQYVPSGATVRYFYNSFVGATNTDCQFNEIVTCACCDAPVGWTACSCPVLGSPAPSPPPPVPPHVVFDGCPGSTGTVTTNPICVTDPTAGEVPEADRPPASEYTIERRWRIKLRCCSLARPATDCESERNNGAGTCYTSELTWAQANQECINDGRRLCTVEELNTPNLCCGTGCAYDKFLVWAEDECSAPPALPPPSPPPPLPSPPASISAPIRQWSPSRSSWACTALAASYTPPA
mgnify:CR=1 FL=1